MAAYKTVELDDLLGGAPIQHREVEGHESQQFLNLFKQYGGIKYLEGGVESGFKKVNRDEYEKRLLHVKGKRNVRVFPVEVSYKSLNKGDVFILDCGLKLFQWNGPKSSKAERAKVDPGPCRELSARGLELRSRGASLGGGAGRVSRAWRSSARSATTSAAARPRSSFWVRRRSRCDRASGSTGSPAPPPAVVARALAAPRRRQRQRQRVLQGARRRGPDRRGGGRRRGLGEEEGRAAQAVPRTRRPLHVRRQASACPTHRHPPRARTALRAGPLADLGCQRRAQDHRGRRGAAAQGDAGQQRRLCAGHGAAALCLDRQEGHQGREEQGLGHCERTRCQRPGSRRTLAAAPDCGGRRPAALLARRRDGRPSSRRRATRCTPR